MELGLEVWIGTETVEKLAFLFGVERFYTQWSALCACLCVREHVCVYFSVCEQGELNLATHTP